MRKAIGCIFLLLHTLLWANSILHTVVPGDSLETISVKYGVDSDRLRILNYLRRGEDLILGDTLVIPRQYEPDFLKLEPLVTAREQLQSTDQPGESYDIFRRSEERNGIVTLFQLAASRSLPELSPTPTRQLSKDKLLAEAYLVQPGDTLSKIALENEISVRQLELLNPTVNGSLPVGQKLLLPTSLGTETLHSYLLSEGEDLDLVAILFKTSVDYLRQLNNLSAGEDIDSGQIIYLNELKDHTSPAYQVYQVQSGDTLWGLAHRFNVSIRQVQQLNPGLDEKLLIGWDVKIPTFAPETEALNEEEPRRYTIQKGDTLWRIARNFAVPLNDLISVNALADDSVLKEGQELIIPRQEDRVGDENDASQFYLVKSGDTLWGIAQQFSISVSALRNANDTFDDWLPAGAQLKIPSLAPPTTEVSEREQEPEFEIEGQVVAQKELLFENTFDDNDLPIRPPEIPDPWASFFVSAKPEYSAQPSRNYFEDFINDPLENYRKAKNLIDDFDRQLSIKEPKSNALAGYAFVIDPGHGGMDPGFVGVSKDGDGKPLFIIEDEYNYDMAMRLYRELKLHGAEAIMTIISPNHQLIDDYNPQHTLISQKNEVYNSAILNRHGDGSSWPVGNSRGLKNRRVIAEHFFLGVEREKRVFVSIHNDNTPEFGEGRLLLYYDDGLTRSPASADFARKLIPYLGIGAHYRGQNLGVLRDNPADRAVLVEMRNIAYQRNSWAIRYLELRQQDVEMMTAAFIKALTGNEPD